MLKPVDSLLQRDDLWLASQWQQQQGGIATGFEALDQCLCHGGWPDKGVIEVLMAAPGTGESLLLQRLLCPGEDQWLLLVCPPYLPYAPAWMQQGIELANVVCLTDLDRKEQLWAAEQGLASGSCQRVLLWLDTLSVSESRRLQLAAERSGSVAVVFLPRKIECDSHPVSLRVHWTPESVGATLQILKQRGGWRQPQQRLCVQPQGWHLPERPPAATLLQGPW
ncbi:translesion DNA synthesis-associated protein ImuA [Ferrimonas sediminum]|nr:translesion DNA synthesis-associated protein ImuA [Ferrimonas sediminum]